MGCIWWPFGNLGLHMGNGVTLSCMWAACGGFRLCMWAVGEGAEAMGACEDEV